MPRAPRETRYVVAGVAPSAPAAHEIDFFDYETGGGVQPIVAGAATSQVTRTGRAPAAHSVWPA